MLHSKPWEIFLLEISIPRICLIFSAGEELEWTRRKERGPYVRSADRWRWFV